MGQAEGGGAQCYIQKSHRVCSIRAGLAFRVLFSLRYFQTGSPYS